MTEITRENKARVGRSERGGRVPAERHDFSIRLNSQRGDRSGVSFEAGDHQAVRAERRVQLSAGGITSQGKVGGLPPAQAVLRRSEACRYDVTVRHEQLG